MPLIPVQDILLSRPRFGLGINFIQWIPHTIWLYHTGLNGIQVKFFVLFNHVVT